MSYFQRVGPVLIDRRTLSRHLPWIVISLCLFVGAVVSYWFAWEDRTRLPGGSNYVGLTLGILAGLIFVFEFLYWPRRTSYFRSWRIGRAETWLMAHVWLGLLTFPLVLLHSGFQFGGSFTTVFLIVYLLVFCSGIFGLVLQQVIPKWLLEDVPQETIYSQIENVLGQTIADVERKMARLRGGQSISSDPSETVQTDLERVIGSTRHVGTIRRKTRSFGDVTEEQADITALEEAWKKEIRPFLESLGRRSPLLSSPGRADEYFAELECRLDPKIDPLVKFIRQACEKRRQLVRQQWYHFWLHSWLAVHLPLSIALMILLVVHVFTSLKYSVDFVGMIRWFLSLIGW